MKNDCIGILGKLFGHNYKPRYDENDTTSDSVVNQAKEAMDSLFEHDYFANSYDAARILEEFKSMNSIETKYVHDVCVRCGNIIKR